VTKYLFNPDFSVDSLAKQLFLSRSQLYRKFVGTLGQTPKEYILMLKFNKAVEMLKTKKYKIADIAFELGFADAHYFSTSFAQRFGVSPSNYFPKEINS
jgi:AraC-like DNA-binding protein